MKKLCILILLVFPCISYGQAQFRVKIIDEETKGPIQGALVYIEELPVGDQETDVNGQVVFQNVPEDRKVRVNVRKAGYNPSQKEIVANNQIKSDNNTIILLSKVQENKDLVFWGYVHDENDLEVSNATIDFNFAGEIFSTKTNEKGNYRLKIDKSKIHRINSYRVVVYSNICERFTLDRLLGNTEIENIDFELPCTDQNNSPQNANRAIKKENDFTGMDGIWIMHLKSEKHLSPNNSIVNRYEEVKIGINLEFKDEIVVGRYAYREGGNACLEASIEGTYKNGKLEFTVSHYGSCCNGAKMKVILYLENKRLFKGTYEPSTYSNTNCNVWYADVTMMKK